MHCRPTRDGCPLAQKWDEENCEPQVLLHRLGKGLRENDGNLSGVSPKRFIAAEKQSIAPFEMASGLLQVSSPWRNASLGRTSAFVGMGRRAKAFTDSVPIALLLLQSADKAID